MTHTRTLDYTVTGGALSAPVSLGPVPSSLAPRIPKTLWGTRRPALPGQPLQGPAAPRQADLTVHCGTQNRTSGRNPTAFQIPFWRVCDVSSGPGSRKGGGAGRSAANQRVQPNGSLEAPEASLGFGAESGSAVLHVGAAPVPGSGRPAAGR